MVVVVMVNLSYTHEIYSNGGSSSSSSSCGGGDSSGDSSSSGTSSSSSSSSITGGFILHPRDIFHAKRDINVMLQL